MKRFLIILLCLVLAFAVVYYTVFYSGTYLPLIHRGEVSVPFRAEGTVLQMEKSGVYETVTLRGVELFPAKPGAMQTAYALSSEDYLRYLRAIAAMGANCVHVVSVMDADFYEALYTYNTAAERPLLLIQGFTISDRVNANTSNAYDSGLQKSLIQGGKTAVDVVHGRKNLPFSEMGGTGNYRRDVSPWVAGYLADPEWSPDTVAYTDHSLDHSGEYRGEFYETGPEASKVEGMLAEVMDELTAYEDGKYLCQRPVGFLSEPACDFLVYQEEYARQPSKYASMDAEHILPTDRARAGRFAAYRVYDIQADFTNWLTEELTEKLAPILAGLDTGDMYGGYCQLVAEYHSMPCVGFVTFPSSRVNTTDGLPPMTELEQGEKLAQASMTLETRGWAGGIISGWQDNWSRSGWNTSFSMDFETNHLWHDLNTDGQNTGLLAYMPGAESVCVLDGDAGEWAGDKPVLERDGLRVFGRCDEEALYLLVEGADPGKTLYLPLDFCPELGSRSCADPALRFSREADFLLCIDGTRNTRLLVQERYDQLRERFQFNIDRSNPFVDPPERDSDRFILVSTAVDSSVLIVELSEQSEVLQSFRTYESGRLVHGNGDPHARDFNSLADFCFGSGCVELRLTWQQLNVGTPSTMEVHGDYYTRYGVELIPVQEFWVGISRGGDEECVMERMPVRGLGSRVQFRERLKQSYYVMQALWRGGGADAFTG